MTKKNIFFVLFLLVELFCLAHLYASPPSIQDRLKDFIDGKKKFKEKDYNDAIKYLRRFIKQQPYLYEIRDALFYLGESFLKKKEYLEAASRFNQLSNQYPHSKYRTVILFKKGQCYHELKITTRAERNLKQYLKKARTINLKKGHHISANLYLGLIYKNRRKYKKAISYLKTSLNLLKKKKKKYGTNHTLNKQMELIYYEIGVMYAKHFRKKKIAFYYLKKYIKSKKDIPASLKFTMRGLSLFHLGVADGLPERSISDIKVDGDDVWVSTWGGGLVRFSRSSERFVKIHLPSSQVRNFYIDFDKVYICTYDGIFIYDKRSDTVEPIVGDHKIFSIAQKVIKDDRYLYFTTLSKGVVRYDSINHQIVLLGKNSFIGSNQLYAIAADHRYLVFGTINSGLIIYNKKEKKATYLDEKHLGGDNIKSILIDGRFLWIGVHKHGIYKYDLNRKKVYKLNWGITYPSTITKREHEIWIGSSGSGIRVYNQKTEKLEKLRAIEGLASNEIHLIEIETDYIWIGYLDAGIDLLYRPLAK